MEDFAKVESPDKKSLYNSALSILYRIDAVWQDANRHARNGELIRWNLDLDAVWRELSEDVQERKKDDDPDNKTDTELFEGFNKELINIGLFSLGSMQVGFQQSPLLAKARSAAYLILMRKEIFLRKLQNKQNKGSAYQDSIESYMD